MIEVNTRLIAEGVVEMMRGKSLEFLDTALEFETRQYLDCIVPDIIEAVKGELVVTVDAKEEGKGE